MTESASVHRPRALFEGARVALVAPAGPLDPERIALSEERCRHLGLTPVLYPHAAATDGFLAGPDADRLADLQHAFDDPTTDAVWALRGGYGTLRIVDGLDLDRLARDPIPFIGFSDNTTIHIALAASNVVSFHGPHPGGDFPLETEAAFRKVLFSDEPPGQLVSRPVDPPPTTLVSGVAEGRLWGGNLSMLASLCGSSIPMSAQGRILVLEDVGEPAYRVDRMLTQLDRAGVLAGAAGLALGRFSGATPGEDPAVDSTRTVLREFAQKAALPCVFGLPFGHVEHNATLPLGARARMDADAAVLDVLEAAVKAAG